jgi:hypothetical protein
MGYESGEGGVIPTGYESEQVAGIDHDRSQSRTEIDSNVTRSPRRFAASPGCSRRERRARGAQDAKECGR